MTSRARTDKVERNTANLRIKRLCRIGGTSMRVVQPLEVAHFISQKGYSPAMRITPATLDDSLPIHNNIVRVAYNNPDMFRGFREPFGPSSQRISPVRSRPRTRRP